MVIEFDFEIYKNGDYDKVYLRNGKEARVLCDNGKGNSPMVVMIIILFFVITKLAGGISMVNRVSILCYR